MEIKVVPVDLATEAVHLSEMDVEIFGSDGFADPEDWEGLECFWVTLHGVKIGSVALLHNSASAQKYDDDYPEVPGSLYILSVGLLSEFRYNRVGSYLVQWIIDYARIHGFSVVHSHCRAGNLVSYRLHARVLQEIGAVKDYYREPTEDSILFELRLEP